MTLGRAGTLVVNFNGGRDTLAIKVAAGHTLYLKYTIVNDKVAIGNTAVTVVSNQTAEAEMGGIHLIKKMIRNPDELK